MGSSDPTLTIAVKHPSLGSVAADALMPFVRAVRYVESLEALDAAVVTLAGPWNAAPPSSLRGALAPGSVLTLELTDIKGKARSVLLDVVTARHDRANAGGATVTLQALEPLQRLRGMRTTQVSDDGGEALELLAAAAKTAEGGSAKRASVRDEAAFGVTILDRPLLAGLKRVARQRGLLALVALSSSGTPALSFEKLGDGDALSLPWGTDAMRAELTMDLSRQVTGVKVYGLPDPTVKSQADKDPKEGKAPKSSGSSSKLSGVTLVKGWKLQRELEVEAWLAPDTATDDPAASEVASPCTPSALDAEATRILAEIARQFVRGRIMGQAWPTARANGALTLSGAPWPFDSSFVITEVQHTWLHGESFRTEISFEADTLGKP